MIETSHCSGWSSAFGVMMQRDAGRRLMMALEQQKPSACKTVQDGCLVDLVRALVDQQVTTH